MEEATSVVTRRIKLSLLHIWAMAWGNEVPLQAPNIFACGPFLHALELIIKADIGQAIAEE